MSHVCDCGDCSSAVFEDRCRFEADNERLREALEWIYAEPEDALEVQRRALEALTVGRIEGQESAQ